MNPETLDEIHSEIKSQLKKYTHSVLTKNIDGVLEIFTDDAVPINNQLKKKGHKGIKLEYGAIFKQEIKEFDIVPKHIYAVEDKIFETGSNKVIGVVDGKEKEIKRSFATIWKKVDGKWKMSIDIIPPELE